MKNTIKILCLIIFTTFSLSSFGGGSLAIERPGTHAAVRGYNPSTVGFAAIQADSIIRQKALNNNSQNTSVSSKAVSAEDRKKNLGKSIYQIPPRPQPEPEVITSHVQPIVNPPIPPKPKPPESIGQQFLAWVAKSLNIPKKELALIDFTGETSAYSRLENKDQKALKEIAEQPKCPAPSCPDVVKNSLNKMKKHGVKEVYILSHSKGDNLERNYDKTDEILNPIDLIKHGQKMNINVHIVACNTGLNNGIGGFKVPVSLAKVINYAKENAEVLTAEEFHKGFTKIHGEGNFVTSIHHQERFEPNNDSGEPNIPLAQKFANELNESIISATVDVQNKKTSNHQNYKLIYPASKTNQSTYIDEKENMNATH